MNNKLATETCVDYKINSKANEITDVRKYKSYSSVTQLGLTSGSATIVGLWNAMPNESFYFGFAADFTTEEVPATNGSVYILKKANWRGRVEYYGTNAGYGDYKMYCVGTNGIPDGIWRRLSKPIGTGTTFSFSNVAMFVGFLTSNATQIFFSIPLPSIVPSGLTASLSGNATIRHADGGYILNNTSITSLGSLAYIMAENYVRVTITLSSASTYTNNSLVVIHSANLVLSFN